MSEAEKFLMEHWGEDGKAVIRECAKYPPLDMDCGQFLDYCVACGGNWGGMYLSGLKKLRPAVWDAIPNEMGNKAFICIVYVLQLCGVDTSR